MQANTACGIETTNIPKSLHRFQIIACRLIPLAVLKLLEIGLPTVMIGKIACRLIPLAVLKLPPLGDMLPIFLRKDCMQANTACGIETNTPILVGTGYSHCMQANTACGIETTGARILSDEQSTHCMQANTACGIETLPLQQSCKDCDNCMQANTACGVETRKDIHSYL